MARPVILTKHLTAAVDNCIATNQTVSAGVAFNLNGSAASGGVATLDTQRRVLFTFAADESSNFFTIVGTRENGVSATEVVAGGATTAVSLTDFYTITSIKPTSTTGGNVKVGTNGVGSTRWYILDAHIAPATTKMGAVVSGTVNFSAEYTYDDVQSISVPTAWTVSGMGSKTANTDGGVEGVAAVRLTINSGTGTTTMTVIQEGIRGN